MLLLFPSLAVGFSGLLGVISYEVQLKRTSLRDHGVATVAELVGKHQEEGSKGKRPYLDYRYRVAEVDYPYSPSVSMTEFDQAVNGQEVELIYLPERPGTSDPASKVRATAYSVDAIVLGVLGGALGLVMWGLWYYLRRSYQRLQRLACYGVTTQTKSLSLHSFTLMRSIFWSVQYTYAAPDGTRRGSTTVDAKTAALLRQPDARATVFYDPLDTARSELYLVIARSIRVTPGKM